MIFELQLRFGSMAAIFAMYGTAVLPTPTVSVTGRGVHRCRRPPRRGLMSPALSAVDLQGQGVDPDGGRPNSPTLPRSKVQAAIEQADWPDTTLSNPLRQI